MVSLLVKEAFTFNEEVSIAFDLNILLSPFAKLDIKVAYS
jgi:hypothetical protein